MVDLTIGIKKWARLNGNIAEYLRKGYTVSQLLDAFLSTEALARTICALDGLDYNIIYSPNFEPSSFDEIKERLTAALYPHVLAVKRDLQAKLLAKSLVEEASTFPQISREEAFRVFEDEHDLLIHDMHQQPIFSAPHNDGKGILEQIEEAKEKEADFDIESLASLIIPKPKPDVVDGYNQNAPYIPFSQRNNLTPKPYPTDTFGVRNLFAGKPVVTEKEIDKWAESRKLGTTLQPPMSEEEVFEKMRGTMEASRNVGNEVKKETGFEYASDYIVNRKHDFHIHKPQARTKLAEQMFPILAIGDLHAPFIKEGYLDFCKDLVRTYKVQSTVFLGDIVDNHRLSRFPKSTKSDVWKTERLNAKKQLASWHYAFPDAYVMIGNHDERFAHRMHELELDDAVIPSLNDLYDLPTWKFRRSLNVGDLYYFTHGTGKGHAKIRENVLRRDISYVVGHFHNKFGQEYVTQDKSIIYCGCGVDTESYAFDYQAADDKNSITGAMIIYPSFVIPVPMFCKKMNNTVLSNEKD